MKSRISLSFGILFFGIVSAGAQTTYSGATGAYNADTWNDAGNWSAGVPSGTTDVIIDTNEYVSANSGLPAGPTPHYTGSLTLNSGAGIIIGQSATTNDLNTLGTGTITMNDGARITLRYGEVTFTQPFIISGNALIKGSESSSGHHFARYFEGGFSGDGTVTFYSDNNNPFHMNAASTMSGLFVVTNDSCSLIANVDGAFGTADVLVANLASFIISGSLSDTIDDGAALILSGPKDVGEASKLILNSDETVDTFTVDGFTFPAGTYGTPGSGADIELAQISGSGILTAASGPDLPLLGGELGVFKPWVNGGINPATGVEWKKGDQYRLLFRTAGATNAESSIIGAYNAFVQGESEASTNYPLLGAATWYVVGSTLAVDARDNTETNPTEDGDGIPVLALDGASLLAENNTDLWDGSLGARPKYDQNGVEWTGDTFTGSDKYNGVVYADNPIGNVGGSVVVGHNNNTGTGWIRNFQQPASSSFPFYALSAPLRVVSTAPKGTMLLVK